MSGMANSASSKNWADKKIFTTGEAAEVCKVSQQTIIRCFDSGRLQGFRVPGSRFRRIPREELIKFMRANDIPLDALESGTKRVLVVDDDPQIIELFEDMLSRTGDFDIRTATTGYDAGMLTASFKPHLIVLDYMLPDINGNVVCERLRQNPNGQDVKVVFVSGVINHEEIEELLASGGDAFIKKPFDVDELMSKINELLEV